MNGDYCGRSAPARWPSSTAAVASVIGMLLLSSLVAAAALTRSAATLRLLMHPARTNLVRCLPFPARNQPRARCVRRLKGGRDGGGIFYVRWTLLAEF